MLAKPSNKPQRHDTTARIEGDGQSPPSSETNNDSPSSYGKKMEPGKS
jgi:hypothetical protein